MRLSGFRGFSASFARGGVLRKTLCRLSKKGETKTHLSSTHPSSYIPPCYLVSVLVSLFVLGSRVRASIISRSGANWEFLFFTKTRFVKTEERVREGLKFFSHLFLVSKLTDFIKRRFQAVAPPIFPKTRPSRKSNPSSTQIE